MTVWIFGATLVVAGMCKAATPGVMQSRASQRRARASRRLGAGVIVIVLKPATYTPK